MNRTPTGVTSFIALSAALGTAACDTTLDFYTEADASDSGSHLVSHPDAGCGLSSDPMNCGTCGHSCLGGACTSGVCQPVVLASGQGDSIWQVPWYPYMNGNGDLDGPDRLAVDATDVYWLNLRGEVMRVPIAGGTAVRVATTEPNPAWIALDAEFVYFSTLEGEIFRVKKTSGSPFRLVSTAMTSAGRLALERTNALPVNPYPLEVSVAGGQLLWSDGSGVYACPAAGCYGVPTAIDPGTPWIHPFSYGVDSSGQKYASEEDVQPTNDAGTDTTVSFAMTYFMPMADEFLGLAGNTAYYELHGGAHEVYALATAAMGSTGVVRWTQTSVTYLASGLLSAPRSLALDDDYAYWVNAAAYDRDRDKRVANVVRCPKTGCASPEVLAANQLVPRAVAVGNGVAFWTTGDGKVWKLALPSSATASSP
jgi:hypothetical protein